MPGDRVVLFLVSALWTPYPPAPSGFIALVSRWLSKIGENKIRRPDISFVKEIGLFNLSTTPDCIPS
jgi:hypothetical protein